MKMSADPRVLAVMASMAAVVTACAVDNPVEPLPEPSFEYFACAVQPVLDQGCSFPACHGDVNRGLQVLSPSRMRIASEYALARMGISDEQVEEGVHPPLTGVELSFNYEQCRGWAKATSTGRPPALLDKPLAVRAGGIYHTAAGDVFASEDDPGYRAIEAWLRGAGPEACP